MKPPASGRGDHHWALITPLTPFRRCGESDQRNFFQKIAKADLTSALTSSGVTYDMNKRIHRKFMHNTCLKEGIHSHHRLVTVLTPRQSEDRESDQRYKWGENQSSLHLTAENRWFVLTLWGNPVNMHSKVLARHLHQMTYPGHRAGVTTDSSTQLEESVQLLITRNAMNHYGKKQRRSHRCHTRMHRMQNGDRCWKTQPWSLSLYNNKKPKKQSWKAWIDEILPSTEHYDLSSRNKIVDK